MTVQRKVGMIDRPVEVIVGLVGRMERQMEGHHVGDKVQVQYKPMTDWK